MERTRVERWVAAYERLWRTPGTDRLAEVFAPDVAYRPLPWAPTVIGLEALAGFWEDERDGAAEPFTMTSAVVAVDGETAVVRVEVAYGSGDRWRDLWVVTLDAEGRCASFEEWPFAPQQPDGHP